MMQTQVIRNGTNHRKACFQERSVPGKMTRQTKLPRSASQDIQRTCGSISANEMMATLANRDAWRERESASGSQMSGRNQVTFDCLGKAPALSET